MGIIVNAWVLQSGELLEKWSTGSFLAPKSATGKAFTQLEIEQAMIGHSIRNAQPQFLHPVPNV